MSLIHEYNQQYGTYTMPCIIHHLSDILTIWRVATVDSYKAISYLNFIYLLLKYMCTVTNLSWP